jgi:hypothetical protein
MRKRTFGRWVARLALLAAIGAGVGAFGVLGGAGSGNVLADVGWQVAAIQVDGGETAL